jgi:hypothetical protein
MSSFIIIPPPTTYVNILYYVTQDHRCAREMVGAVIDFRSSIYDKCNAFHSKNYAPRSGRLVASLGVVESLAAGISAES